MDNPSQARVDPIEIQRQDQMDLPGSTNIDRRDKFRREGKADDTGIGMAMDEWMAARHTLATNPLLGHALMTAQSMGPSTLLASESKALGVAAICDEAGVLTSRGHTLLQVQERLLELEMQGLPERDQDLYQDLFQNRADSHRVARQREAEREQEAKALRTRNVDQTLSVSGHDQSILPDFA
ncbi:MAG: hypothetical protein ACLPXB_00675 [Thiobacillaceae bacterium]